jgi:hypothetical protein
VQHRQLVAEGEVLEHEIAAGMRVSLTAEPAESSASFGTHSPLRMDS